MQEWLIDNGLQVATLITLVILIFKVSRWSGIIETRITNLEGWLSSHTKNHPGVG